MQIPTLPTDSLYKFQALAGLWLVVAALALPGYGIFQLENLMIENERDISLVNLESQQIQSELARLNQLARVFSQPTTEAQTNAEAINVRVRELARQRVILKSHTDKARVLLNTHRSLLVFLSLFGLVGFGQTFLGFKRWHEIQSINDELIRRSLHATEKFATGAQPPAGTAA